MRKFTTILILICSILISFLGLFIIGFGYFYLEPFMKYILAEIFNINVWQLNWNVIGFLFFSIGIVGIIAGVAIWKNKEGGERFWLLLISWQFFRSLIQIGPYSIGSPDVISIIVVGCIAALSWITYCREGLKPIFINSKYYILEIVLLITITSQVMGIFVLNAKEDSFSVQNIEDKIENGMHNAILAEMYGERYDDFKKFFDDYFEAKNAAFILKSGEFLLENGYKNNRFILRSLAIANYFKGNKYKAAELLKSAIKGNYASKLAKPSNEGIYLEEAQLHYMLFLIYNELGIENNSKKEYKKAIELFKKVFGEKYDEEVLEINKKLSIDTLNHFVING